MDTKTYKTKLAEYKTRVAAVGDKVAEQNAAQKAIGPGSREAPTEVSQTNNGEAKGNKVEKQNSNQQEIHNQGGQKEPSTKARPSTLSTGSF